jgi:uncharacterized protein (TIGR03118 family)
MRKHLAITAAVAALGGAAVVAGVALAGDDDRGDRQSVYEQTNLVSNRSDVGAKIIDPNVRNPWGLAAAPNGALWVSANGTSASTLYTLKDDVPSIVNLVVRLAAQDKPTQFAPTGIVWNPSPGDFKFQGDKKTDVNAVFIFASEDGRIVAWNPGANADRSIANTVVTTPGAVYKGLAFATAEDGGNLIFATNFHAGTVDVFDTSFKPVTQIRLVDRDIPAGFAPFGIATIEHELFVSFAKQDKDKKDDVAGAGLGFVDVFTPNGELIRRLVSRGVLNAPWGMVHAPLGFGKFGGALLIGNFGDGRINAFDNHGNFLGALRNRKGQPIAINGLWALMFDTFQGAGTEDLYFSAGINDEKDGLIGEIAVASGKH